jgi:transcriptional regulator with XRE-family HTH domain
MRERIHPMNKQEGVRVNTLLRKERLLRGWSQQDVANHMGVTVVTVNRWERGVQQPNPLFRLKLCQLFNKSEEELGLWSEEKDPPRESHEELLQESDCPPVHVPDQQPVHEEIPFLHQAKPALSNHRFPFKFRLLLFGVLGILLLTSMTMWLFRVPLFFPPTIPHPIASSQTTPPRRALYQAQWSKDRGGWIASSRWHWSDQEGGMITTDSQTNSLMFAPYQPSSSTYAVEASIQYLSHTDWPANAFGVLVGRTRDKGEVCGVGVHEQPEHLFIGQLAVPTRQNQPIIADTVSRSAVVMDTQWHTYRVEVTPSHLRFFFDGKFIAQVLNETHIQQGQVGIYVVGTYVKIRNFAVFAL